MLSLSKSGPRTSLYAQTVAMGLGIVWIGLTLYAWLGASLKGDTVD